MKVLFAPLYKLCLYDNTCTLAEVFVVNGEFSIRALPVQAQFAPVFGMSVADVNSDGNLDVVLVGNSHATETDTGY